MQEKIIIFTDLDGTLLDKNTYSFEKALPVVKKLKERKIPLIFCTGKTRAENEYYQKKLGLREPFIVENGGAIFIPKGYFSFPTPEIIKLGVSVTKLREALEKIRKKTKFKILGFGDMTAKEVAKDANLPLNLAKLAKKKEFNESFKFLEPKEKEKILFREIKKLGFNYAHGGRYYNIFGKNTDKGKAVKKLTELFKREFKKVKSIGLGDSPNDIPMLKAVDLPILVKTPEGKWHPKVAKLKKVVKIDGIGPEGWVKAIEKYVLKEKL